MTMMMMSCDHKEPLGAAITLAPSAGARQWACFCKSGQPLIMPLNTTTGQAAAMMQLHTHCPTLLTSAGACGTHEGQGGQHAAITISCNR